MRTTLILVFAFITPLLSAQEKKASYEIGLFTSLYLDQQFNAVNELKTPTQVPKTVLSSLEFYEGTSLAIDSLNATGKRINLTVFDVQSADGHISRLFENGTFNHLDLIISQLSGDAFFQLAIIAQEMNIPIVNATYPNSKGIKGHEGLYIANPRINSHLEVLQKKVAVNWKAANIIWFKRDNQADRQIEELFTSYNLLSGKNKFNHALITLKNDFSQFDVLRHYDSSKPNVFILGSLDESFALKVINSLTSVKNKSNLHLVGMPGWENLKTILLPRYKDYQFYYTTAFYIPKEHQFVNQMDKLWEKEIGEKAPSMFLKGFEITFFFASMLAQQGKIKIGQSFTPKAFKVLTDFDFVPVYPNTASTSPDFYENKRIQFIRLQNGLGLPFY